MTADNFMNMSTEKQIMQAILTGSAIFLFCVQFTGQKKAQRLKQHRNC